MDLHNLAKKHKIEENLFHSSNLAKMFHLIGRRGHVEITKRFLDMENPSDKQKWEEIIKYLDKELKIKQEILLYEKSLSMKTEEEPKRLDCKSSVSKSYAISDFWKNQPCHYSDQ